MCESVYTSICKLCVCVRVFPCVFVYECVCVCVSVECVCVNERAFAERLDFDV